MSTIVNLTPHVITIEKESGERIDIPSNGSIRVSEVSEKVMSIDGIAIFKKEFADLPKESMELLNRFLSDDNVKVIIVSMPTAMKIKEMIARGKIKVKGKLITHPASYLRDEEGRVVAVRGLAAVNLE